MRHGKLLEEDGVGKAEAATAPARAAPSEPTAIAVAALPRQHAEGEPDVVGDQVERHDAPELPALLAQPCRVAERTERGRPCAAAVQTFIHELLGPPFEMPLDFVTQLGVETIAPDHEPQAAEKPSHQSPGPARDQRAS